MERNQVTMIVVGVAALLGAVALGVVLSRPSGEEPKAGPTLEVTKAPEAEAAAPRPEPRPASKRPIPEAPTAVSAYVTTESGLQYADITVGDGAQPAEGDLVAVEYTGWLEDGRMFDSSFKRSDPFVFPLGKRNVIRGWDEGVATMKVGGKRQLKVPADLAYGSRARGIIPPNATLIFDVELKDVKPPRKVPPAPAKITGAYTKTASGLELFDFAAGDGVQPTKGQVVRVEYSGWLENGTLFDSSYKRNGPLTFPIGVGKVIPGWDEGVGTMKVGGRRQLRIPPGLGYGDRDSGPIPANSTLIFDVELVGVE